MSVITNVHKAVSMLVSKKKKKQERYVQGSVSLCVQSTSQQWVRNHHVGVMADCKIPL